MEDLKSNAEIRGDAAKWVAGIKSTLDADSSCRKIILSPFLEPWTRAVTIGELVNINLRWREIAPNQGSRLRCLQVAHFNNLLDWPVPPFTILRMRPENLFDPPPRAEMLDTLRSCLGNLASIGDTLKIEGGWAVATSEAEKFPETIPGFTIRNLSQVEIADLPKATTTGKKTISVPSPRIDAVAAKALKPSREQIKKHLESGGVLLNYEPARKPGIELAPGDIVAVRIGGSFRFDEITGVTKKGRVNAVVEILNGP